MDRLKRRYFEECPNCGGTMEEKWTDCGDDDPQCDCDVAWDCPHCGRKYLIPCYAHIVCWTSTELQDGREVYVDEDA